MNCNCAACCHNSAVNTTGQSGIDLMINGKPNEWTDLGNTSSWSVLNGKLGLAYYAACAIPERGPRPIFGPPEGGVFRLRHDGGLAAPSRRIVTTSTAAVVA